MTPSGGAVPVVARSDSTGCFVPTEASELPGGERIVLRAVAQFAAAGLVALVVVAVVTQFASRRIGERSAIDDARAVTLLRAQAIAPYVTQSVLDGDGAAGRRLDAAVKRRVLDRSLIRVKIWRRDGTILYSDESRLVGRRFPLESEELDTLRSGRRAVAGVSDLSEPENRFERPDTRLLEVYAPLRSAGGTKLLFEAYFRYSAVTAAGDRWWRNSAPWTIGALVLLQLVQIPLAYSLARRLQRRERDRARVLGQALDASTTERRRIAADLHDGVVQGLVGTAYTLGGLARRRDLDPDVAAHLSMSEHDVRDSVQALRSLLVEIYPPNLFEEGLAAALDDLVARLRTSGVDATLVIDGLDRPPSPTVSALIFRVAQETVRNITAHARATNARVSLVGSPSRLVLTIVDDGVGCDPPSMSNLPSDGHFGLRGVRDLVAEAGGSFSFASAPGAGTTVEVEVPRS